MSAFSRAGSGRSTGADKDRFVFLESPLDGGMWTHFLRPITNHSPRGREELRERRRSASGKQKVIGGFENKQPEKLNELKPSYGKRIRHRCFRDIYLPLGQKCGRALMLRMTGVCMKQMMQCRRNRKGLEKKEQDENERRAQLFAAGRAKG